MNPLEPLAFPLNGQALIEASAGTGKTYTISSFYLRLILGHGCEPLPVEEVLIVTFTNAATNELKERLHARLHKAFVDFEQGNSDDKFIQALIEALADKSESSLKLAKQRLLVAMQSMDNAAIYTIHSFCQRMLLEYAFERGALYERRLILDDSEWQKLAITDFWRQFVADMPRAELQLFLQQWPSPNALLQSIRPLLNRDVLLVSDKQTQIDKDKIVKLLNDYETAVDAIKRWWLQNELMQQIQDAGLKANAKLAKPDILKQMQSFAQGTRLQLSIGKADSWEVFSAEKVAAAAKKGSKDLSHLNFEQFDHLHQLQEQVRQHLRLYYVAFSVDWMRTRMAEQKRRFNLISPDDLLQNLQQALQHESQGEALATAIAGKYPVAMVDEFQDTDPIQFSIFQRIYIANPENKPANNQTSLILIGDPKQAIYGFRGGDIFTYLKAKQLISEQRQYTLNTNFRSQKALVASLNHLFQPNTASAFQFGEAIPYHQVEADKGHLGLKQQDASVAALQLGFLTQVEEGKYWSWANASRLLAQHFSEQIADLLNSQTYLLNDIPVKAGDICVLVRDRNEAQIMKEALAAVNVDSVYLARKSVFASEVAYQMLLLLRALHSPQDESLVRAALLTELFPWQAYEFDAMLKDELRWHEVLSCFRQAHQFWLKQGVMRAINHVLLHFQVYQHLIRSFSDGLRRITDVRHLGELLQVEANALQGEGLLLKWFETRLSDPDHNHQEQQLRLETDENLVQITTIHASKGLQYPLVFIPFACRYKEAKEGTYHKPDIGLVWDAEPDEQGQMLQEAQRMGEDSRLLYVALTRAEYHCWLGVWNNAAERLRSNSGFMKTAMGQVLLASQELESPAKLPDSDIIQAIQALAAKQNDVSIKLELIQPELEQEQEQKQKTTNVIAAANRGAGELEEYSAAQLSRNMAMNWVLTSYSGISQHGQHGHQDAHEAFVTREEQGKAADEQSDDKPEKRTVEQELAYKNALPMRFAFERGVNPGSFLHAIYELSDWQELDASSGKDGNPSRSFANVAKEQAQRYGITSLLATETLQPFDDIAAWIRETMQTPIQCQFPNETATFQLQDITESQRIAEMEFYLPLKQVNATAFNALLRKYDFPARYPYDFGQLSGMLKGYIDLTLEYQGRFYVADYKSNHLGDDFACYDQNSMAQAMWEHDYNLQALIYTVALHRYLSVRLSGYDYDTHIGGACYLFVRGMHPEYSHMGCLHLLPEKSLVMELNTLFYGMVETAAHEGEPHV
ncbi:exodeoxyribonuclease V subunit beta [Paraneptunicella aestuarii]|uniref:exodeoxyribonuclease V subunit beta n=1 Tax=Paraneptunicella aestuarii TaxID=2831148 RepID=UPI001E603667|nr:exodeoxyribonuclease V subunit beta [Paraneptunicella aestuarii]UAA40494.1 exodeoxyribonuclease V subunit beta [Paraneptunicella aestuarii]